MPPNEVLAQQVKDLKERMQEHLDAAKDRARESQDQLGDLWKEVRDLQMNLHTMQTEKNLKATWLGVAGGLLGSILTAVIVALIGRYIH